MIKPELNVNLFSFLGGLICCIALFMFLGFSSPNAIDDGQVGRYQVVITDSGSDIVILDTTTGEYIRRDGSNWINEKFGNPRFIKEYNTRKGQRK